MLTALPVIFVLGYLLIAFEHPARIDKAASALLTAVFCWVLLALADTANVHELPHHLADIAGILFFLLGAMTIVELVDVHDGFSVITQRIRSRNKVVLLWVIGIISFFLSAVLDNLTTTIVMVSLLRKLFADRSERWLFAGVVVIAANAGGAWSPIGDITTTMLWIGNQISATGIMHQLFIPSVVCLLVPLVVLSFRLRGEITAVITPEVAEVRDPVTTLERNVVFGIGVAVLLFVPVFKTWTHLPPYLGVLFGLGVLWAVTEILHRSKNHEAKHPLSVAGVLQHVDTTTIFFFLGILLAVSALATSGHLQQLADYLRVQLDNVYAINVVIGLLSSVVDNVPLVAGAMKMYPLVTVDQLGNAPEHLAWLSRFVIDGRFWQLLAYCAGTGGSCLIIGSAAGVAAMGMEKIDFFWYLKHVSGLALIGYLAGAAVYIAMV